MKLIKHLLDRKGRHIISVKPEDSVLDAIRLMAEKGIGSLVVMEDQELLGIMSERDYARKVIVKGRASDNTPVADIMTADVLTTSGAETVNACMSLMTEKKIRHLPVVDGDTVVAMISIGDLVEAIIADQQEEIEHLEHYISG
jgi:CBS domain-containing protein